MIKFIIVRHGFSLSNLKSTMTGQLDEPLTEMGLIQGKLVSEYIFENYHIDAIYSSDLSRAVDTIAPLSKMAGIPIIKEQRLRELHAGEWQGINVSELMEKYGEIYEKWRVHDPSIRPPKGESMQELQERGITALKDIAKLNDGKTVVIATHGGLIKTLHAYFLGLPVQKWKDLSYLPNASILEVDFDNELFKITTGPIDHYLGNMHTEMPKGI